MKLYALCDQGMLDDRSVSLDKFLEIANSKNAEILQYRNKNTDIAFMKKQLIYIRKHFSGFLIVNDAYELIEFCDGVHLGQEDLKSIDEDIYKAVKIIRNVIKEDKILGISTHNEEEVLQANEMDLNYIGLGAYRDTSTKKDVSIVLGDSIETIASKSKHLVAAIGGVKLDDHFENITYHAIGSGLVA
jgi:thiamine-phosphate pyrophosphorylase